MVINLTQEDLINLVNGLDPNYSVFENNEVSPHGSYDGSQDKWKWHKTSLSNLDEEELLSLYRLCKDSWY